MKKLREIIDATDKPITVKTIQEDLAKLGIRQGDTVMVHASLSKIGYIVNGAISVIHSLINTVGETGTIVMPSQSTSNSDPSNWSMPPVPKEWWETIRENMPVYDKNSTPTDVSKLAELFRTYPGTQRSDHPQTSFTARGKNARSIIIKHLLTPCFGENTPLSKMYSLDTKILMIGTDYDTVTAFHLAEVRSKRCSVSENACAIMKDRKRVWHVYNDYDYENNDFIKIGQAFEKVGEVTTGKIGNAISKVFDFKQIVDFAEKVMKG